MLDSVNTRALLPTEPGAVRDAAPYLLSVLCAGVFSFLSGGYIFVRTGWVAVAYLCLAAVWVWFLRRRTPPSALYLVALTAFAALVAWTGLSVLWSFGPDLTWVAFDVAALYLVVAAVVGLTPAGSLQLRVAGLGFLMVATAVAVYAFLGKGLPEVVTHAHSDARLHNPIGYYNVLALLMVMGLLVALSLAGDRVAHTGWRVAAAAAGVPLCLTFFFTLSRGGWVVLCLSLVLYFGLTTTRLSSLASLVAILAPVAAALWSVRGLDTLFRVTADDALRAQEGHTLLRWALVALAAAAALQLAVALVHRALPWARWLRLAAGVAVVLLLVAAVVGGSWRFLAPRGGFTWVGDRAETFLTGTDEISSGEGAGRLMSVNTGRPPMWREALEQSARDRMWGTGAGTFVFSHYRFREGGGVVKHAHSQWLNVLSELGVVGLGLLVASILLFVAAAIRNPFVGRADPLRPLLVALQASVVAFVVHISWDWDWDMAAIGTVFFLFAATCSSYLTSRGADRRRDESSARDRDVSQASGDPEPDRGEPAASPGESESHAPSRRRSAGGVGSSWPLRVVATLAIALVAASWLPPYLSARAERAAIDAAGDGDVARALRDARRAARFDPLAARPLITQALLLQRLGRQQEAMAVLDRAARLQPDNYEVYYQRGVLLLTAFGRKDAAVAQFRRALALNPEDAASRQELSLALGR